MSNKTTDDRSLIHVFQQKGRGESKIKGIIEGCPDRFRILTTDIEHPLPEVIDDSSGYLPESIEADLVLDYLLHPDLSEDLEQLCKRLNIPIIASGKKRPGDWAMTPPVCCALPPAASCGQYGRLFGYPRFNLELDNGKISRIEVLRGAPCGATQRAAEAIQGMPLDKAMETIGLQTQFFCTADPANWEPLGGKSPVHLAADLHLSALKEAISRCRRQEDQGVSAKGA
jgi:hypothetical protein